MQNNDFSMSDLPTEEGYKLRPRDIGKIIEISIRLKMIIPLWAFL